VTSWYQFADFKTIIMWEQYFVRSIKAAQLIHKFVRKSRVGPATYGNIYRYGILQMLTEYELTETSLHVLNQYVTDLNLTAFKSLPEALQSNIATFQEAYEIESQNWETAHLAAHG
jgi:hypothetical protein